MHEPCAHFAEADGADVNGGDIRTGRHPLSHEAGGKRSQQGWVEALTKKLHILVSYSDQLPVCSSHLSYETRNMEETEGTEAR